MKRFVKRSLFALFGGALLLSSIAGCAGGRWHDGDPQQMQARMVERIGSKLELDDVQKQKLGVLAERLREQRDAMRQGGDPRERFRALLAGPQLDQAAAQTLVEEKTAAVQAGSPRVIAAAADFFDHLNASQQQKVRDFLAQGVGTVLHGAADDGVHRERAGWRLRMQACRASC